MSRRRSTPSKRNPPKREPLDAVEREELILKGADPDYEPDPRGLGYQIYTCMRQHIGDVAQLMTSTGEAHNYGHLLERCINTAYRLRYRVDPDPKALVGICSANHSNTCVPLLGAIMGGYKVVVFDHKAAIPTLRHQIKITKPKIVFCSSDYAPAIEQACKEIRFSTQIVSFGLNMKYLSFDEFIRAPPREERFCPVHANDLHDTVAIYFSSGTSGLPKGICITHYGLMMQCHIMTKNGTIRDGPSLYYSSISWLSYPLYLIASIFVGKPSVVINTFDPSTFWGYVRNLKVASVLMLPNQCKLAWENIPRNPEEYASLEQITSVGCSFPVELIRRIQRSIPRLWISAGYGCTEMQGGVLYFNPFIEEHRRFNKSKLLSCGTCAPGVEYKIVDQSTGAALGPMLTGELRMSSLVATAGYYDNIEETPFDQNKWLCTGDLAYYDEDHCFYIVGRIKELLKYKGRHISPELLEMAIETHPGVFKAAVISTPDPEVGDNPLALVQLKEGIVDVTEESIRSHCGNNLSVEDLPYRRLKFMREIPLTPNGKIQKLELKNAASTGLLEYFDPSASMPTEMRE